MRVCARAVVRLRVLVRGRGRGRVHVRVRGRAYLLLGLVPRLLRLRLVHITAGVSLF